MATNKSKTGINRLFNKTASIYSKSRTDDMQGGWIIDYGVIGTTKVRVSVLSGVEKQYAGETDRRITHKVYANPDSNIVRGNKLVIGNLSLEVLDVKEPSLANHHIEIDCIEWQSE